MRRTVPILIATTALLAAFSAPVGAHERTVQPPGGETKHGWSGSLALPGSGQGLIPGGPTGEWLISPSHAKGLVTACHALEANPSVVDIRGPGGPGCEHGH